MAEERIVMFASVDYNMETVIDGKNSEVKFECKIEPHNANVFTRAEAIERIAKAICNMGDEETWGRVDDNYKHYCTTQAEWALNALLGE